MLHRRAALVGAIAVVALALASWACEIRVRDSAFRTARDLHRLYVIAESQDPQADALQSRLVQWLESMDGALNLEIVRINADDPEVNWQSVGIPSAPPNLPVTVLVGRNNGLGESFLIDYWETAPDSLTLASIAESAVRTELAHKLTTNVAVLLYARSDPEAESASSIAISELVTAGISGERIGLDLITVDPFDPSERLLCRFMGLTPGGPDTLCVAFGRGKLMGPPLTGDQITAENVNQLLSEIRQACSCSKPLPTMGVDLPLIWSDEIDSRVVLMDEELDLNSLEAEVEGMLALKAASETGEAATLLKIPTGSASLGPLPDNKVEPTNSLQTDSRSNNPLPLLAFAAAALLLSFVGWKSLRTRR